MHWELEERIDDESTVESKIFQRLSNLEQLRKKEKVFVSNANMWTVETHDTSVLCIGRYYDGEKMYGLFNFSEYAKTAFISEDDGDFKDMISGEEHGLSTIELPGYGFYWLKKFKKEKK